MSTLLVVICGTSCIGAVAGGIGAFSLVRQQSLLGDAISHAALPGIATMFLYTQSTDPFVLMIGGGIAGCIGALLVMYIMRVTTLKRDALLGIILSVFFGFGLVLKTIIQKRGIAHQAILGKFFFGNASTLLWGDVYMMLGVGVCLSVVLAALWHRFVLISFDRAHAHVLGFRVGALDVVLTGITVVAIVMGLHAVGVLLMSALLISPAAAMRQWTNSFVTLFWGAVLLGAASAAGGSYISSLGRNIPTGPVVVIVASCAVVISLLFGTQRGVLRGRSEVRYD